MRHDSEPLYVVVLHFNPGQFRRRDQLTAEFIERLRTEPRVVPVVVECTIGRRAPQHATDALHEFIGAAIRMSVHVNTTCWIKENLFNLAIRHLSHVAPDWKYVAQPDADLTFLNPHWVRDTIEALQVHPVVQMFETAVDLGPTGKAGHISTSFAARLLDGHMSDVRAGTSTTAGHAARVAQLLKAQAYGNSHPGYAWAYTREWLAATGGLFEVAILGSADTIMTCAIVGDVDQALCEGLHAAYVDAARAWQARVAAFGGRVGCVRGTVAHHHHGPKVNRLYTKRTQLLKDHQFDPTRDLVKNECGVIELAGNKPLLEAGVHAYFRLRSEDDITA